jgi:hypothetical protein
LVLSISAKFAQHGAEYMRKREFRGIARWGVRKVGIGPSARSPMERAAACCDGCAASEELWRAIMVSTDYLYVVLLIGALYLMIHMLDWPGGHSWRH